MVARNEETKLAKKALKDAGFKVESCRRGKGTSSGWIYVVLDGPYDLEAYEKAYKIVQKATDRDGLVDDPMTDLFMVNILIDFNRRGGISYAEECRQNRIRIGAES